MFIWGFRVKALHGVHYRVYGRPSEVECAQAHATATGQKWRKGLTFPYRDFSEYACGLANGTP
jgi:hypothetical protein